jgi:hypothetical protein
MEEGNGRRGEKDGFFYKRRGKYPLLREEREKTHQSV